MCLLRSSGMWWYVAAKLFWTVVTVVRYVRSSFCVEFQEGIWIQKSSFPNRAKIKLSFKNKNEKTLFRQKASLVGSFLPAMPRDSSYNVTLCRYLVQPWRVSSFWKRRFPRWSNLTVSCNRGQSRQGLFVGHNHLVWGLNLGYQTYFRSKYLKMNWWVGKLLISKAL